MDTTAIVIDEPARLSMRTLALDAPTSADAVVDILWSGISTGTEKLIFEGTMPGFPGMGYPLVPGYEAVGIVSRPGSESGLNEGDFVFVPGARCFGAVRGLFGATASRIVVAGRRATSIPVTLKENGILLALAATAFHAVMRAPAHGPDLVIGHGVLGRLIARTSIALGNSPPTVWEIDAARKGGACGYVVTDAEDDGRTDYCAIMDASGASGILDCAISRLQKGGSVTLAGFYSDRVAFEFPAAFMREATIAVAAEFTSEDVDCVLRLIAADKLSLDGLISHRRSARDAQTAYLSAFSDAACLKMVLDWRTLE